MVGRELLKIPTLGWGMPVMASRATPPSAPDFQKALLFFQTLLDHAQTLQVAAKEFESSYQTLRDFLNMNTDTGTIQ